MIVNVGPWIARTLRDLDGLRLEKVQLVTDNGKGELCVAGTPAELNHVTLRGLEPITMMWGTFSTCRENIAR